MWTALYIIIAIIVAGVSLLIYVVESDSYGSKSTRGKAARSFLLSWAWPILLLELILRMVRELQESK